MCSLFEGPRYFHKLWHALCYCFLDKESNVSWFLLSRFCFLTGITNFSPLHGWWKADPATCLFRICLWNWCDPDINYGLNLSSSESFFSVEGTMVLCWLRPLKTFLMYTRWWMGKTPHVTLIFLKDPPPKKCPLRKYRDVLLMTSFRCSLKVFIENNVLPPWPWWCRVDNSGPINSNQGSKAYPLKRIQNKNF